jgi:hypothetical protein
LPVGRKERGFGLSDQERHRRFVVASRRRESFAVIGSPLSRPYTLKSPMRGFFRPSMLVIACRGSVVRGLGLGIGGWHGFVGILGFLGFVGVLGGELGVSSSSWVAAPMSVGPINRGVIKVAWTGGSRVGGCRQNGCPLVV